MSFVEDSVRNGVAWRRHNCENYYLQIKKKASEFSFVVNIEMHKLQI
jgi:hypothetical protein